MLGGPGLLGQRSPGLVPPLAGGGTAINGRRIGVRGEEKSLFFLLPAGKRGLGGGVAARREKASRKIHNRTADKIIYTLYIYTLMCTPRDTRASQAPAERELSFLPLPRDSNGSTLSHLLY